MPCRVEQWGGIDVWALHRPIDRGLTLTKLWPCCRAGLDGSGRAPPPIPQIRKPVSQAGGLFPEPMVMGEPEAHRVFLLWYSSFYPAGASQESLCPGEDVRRSPELVQILSVPGFRYAWWN